MKYLLSGNEAIARGAYEAGVRTACAYPGTPSTEILENIAQFDEIYCEWAPNEKVAVEVAQGACMAGGRSIVSMKHVGVNVAADPLFSLAYTGVSGGFIVISADDPGMHSSQNEQDNRYYAKFMKMPLLEPSDSQEAKELVAYGMDISETYDVPVLLRTTTRISHSKGLVECGERQDVPLKVYEKNIAKRVVIPVNARRLRLSLEDRLQRLAQFAETFPGNRVEGTGRDFAVITSGIAYQYAKEALGDRAIFLKLSFTFPLPENLIRNFVSQFDKVYVIEEGEPFLEEQIKYLGLSVIGKEIFPKIGELSVGIIRRALFGVAADSSESAIAVPDRPPVLCPGCPHRGVFHIISKLGAIVTSDIGCYSLGVAPPLSALETCICMGASIGNALGLSKMLPDKKVIATIGDSTFIHSGITGLIDVVYNQGVLTVVIMDNSITGMTGHQHHPGTGFTAKNQPTNKVDLEQLVLATGIKHIWTVNAYDLTAVEKALHEATNCGHPAVVITRQACALIDKHQRSACFVNQDICKYCKQCLKIGCPAIENKADRITIHDTCNGCKVCRQVCKFGAIEQVGGEND